MLGEPIQKALAAETGLDVALDALNDITSGERKKSSLIREKKASKWKWFFFDEARFILLLFFNMIFKTMQLSILLFVPIHGSDNSTFPPLVCKFCS